MEPSLKEKVAFFQQMDACKNCDEQSDRLSVREQNLRQQCKAFFAAASTTSTTSATPTTSTTSLTSITSITSVTSITSTNSAAPATSSALPLPFPRKQLLPPSRPRRTASDPISKTPDDELEIIAVIPIDNRQEATTATSSQVHDASVTNSTAPETERQPDKTFTRRRTHLTTQVLRSQSDLASTPSVAMPKRKRTKPLEMAPESERIFTGLRFFYIPNDDVNPARRLRITKAREHGATWTRNSAEATHIIVDTGLSYDDIKSILDNILASSPFVLVNDRYPIECLRRGDVFDPSQTVEKYQYKIPGDPNFSTKIATAEPTCESSELVPSSHPEEIQPRELDVNHTEDAAETPSITDELETCINAVIDDPEKHQYLDESDSDAQGSEDEGLPEKKRRLRSKGNNEKSNFQEKFMCMRGGTKGKKPVGPNAYTIKLLEEMVEEHMLSNETWRVHSYRKAIATLKRQPKQIVTAKEATALNNIGNSLAEHIEEIVSTGRFQKLDEIRREPSRQALKRFCNVYGAGVPTANKWVELGYRTLDDLRTKAKLSVNQQIGVDHYDDLLTRIPRAEVKALGDHVKDVAAAIDPRVELDHRG
ncbi:hypothetical protein EKO27_g2911 [Xylaria grammica]|uniref:DNA polymerase n=1 Tax=Xylaria grammica TaxID=363999 RepID=A0A439DCS5_9PEZI|nr:hypothetical protein EKO27_g2911 [Xylaria grammica]